MMNNRSIWTTNPIENKYDKNSFAYVKAANSLNTNINNTLKGICQNLPNNPFIVLCFKTLITLGHQFKFKSFQKQSFTTVTLLVYGKAGNVIKINKIVVFG